MGCQSKQINNARKFHRKTLLPTAVRGGCKEEAGSQEVFDSVKMKPRAMNMKIYLLILDSKPHFSASLHSPSLGPFMSAGQLTSREHPGRDVGRQAPPPPPFFSMQPLVSPLEGLKRCLLHCVSFLYDKVSALG